VKAARAATVEIDLTQFIAPSYHDGAPRGVAKLETSNFFRVRGALDEIIGNPQVRYRGQWITLADKYTANHGKQTII
jgi:hypothetical protein